MLNIKPLGSRILVKRSKPEQKKGGIMLLESTQQKENVGVVTAIGTSVTTIAVDDKVLFNPYTCTPVTVDADGDDAEYFIFKEEDILAILN